MSKKTISIILTTSLLLSTSVMPVLASTNESVQKTDNSYQQTTLVANEDKTESNLEKSNTIYVYDEKNIVMKFTLI